MNKKLNREIKIVEQEYVQCLSKIKEARSRVAAESELCGRNPVDSDNVKHLGLLLIWRNGLQNELIKKYWESLGLNEKSL